MDDSYSDSKEFSKVDIIKTTWKCYIPTTILGSVSIACIIASSSINAKRYAALGSLYSVAESSLKEYKDKVKETIGEKKEQAIERKIVRERQRIKKQASYNEKKKKEQEERNELIDQWFKHMGKCINGEFVTIGLDEYTKMTDKQRREWNGEG